jgi:hypothetical protein
MRPWKCALPMTKVCVFYLELRCPRLYILPALWFADLSCPFCGSRIYPARSVVRGFILPVLWFADLSCLFCGSRILSAIVFLFCPAPACFAERTFSSSKHKISSLFTGTFLCHFCLPESANPAESVSDFLSACLPLCLPALSCLNIYV